jgi:superfamily I DNA/RNA helicase
MNEDYHKLVTKLNYHGQLLVLTGDRNQNINEYLGSSDKYLINYEQYFTTGRLWKELTLRTSYRLTPSIANFVNKNIINKELIIPGNFKYNDIKPLYYYSEWNFANENILINLVNKFGPDEVVIMKASVSNISLNKNSTGSCPLGKLISNSSKSGIKFCVREGDILTEKEMKGKVLLSSFNSFKGKERLCTILYGINESYFKYYEKDWPDDKKSLPNILYVACTRAKNCLILVQDDKSQHLRTTNNNIIHSTCNVIGYSNNKKEEIEKKLQREVAEIFYGHNYRRKRIKVAD